MKLLAIACSSLLLVLGCSVLANDSTNSPLALVASFPSGKTSLNAYIFKPDGPGAHPVIVWNHGSPKPILESGPASRFDEVAKFFLNRNFVLFIPDRTARSIQYSDSAGADPNDQEAVASATHALREAFEQNHADFQSAMEWLKKQTFVDKTKIFIGGYSAGANQAMYEAGLNSEVRGVVLFAPGSIRWNTSPFLRDMLLSGASASKAPIFVAQAQNDSQLSAIAALGKELSKKGKPNVTMVYPPHGKTQKEANLFALTGVNVWAEDVSSFLDSVLNQ